MNNMTNGMVYTEVYELINCIDIEFKNKIPKKILDLISTKRDKNYNTRIIKEDPFNVDNISQRACDLFSLLAYKYFGNKE